VEYNIIRDSNTAAGRRLFEILYETSYVKLKISMEENGVDF